MLNLLSIITIGVLLASSVARAENLQAYTIDHFIANAERDAVNTAGLYICEVDKPETGSFGSPIFIQHFYPVPPSAKEDVVEIGSATRVFLAKEGVWEGCHSHSDNPFGLMANNIDGGLVGDCGEYFVKFYPIQRSISMEKKGMERSPMPVLKGACVMVSDRIFDGRPSSIRNVSDFESALMKVMGHDFLSKDMWVPIGER